MRISDWSSDVCSSDLGEVIGLLNNDIEVITPDWLTEMVGHALRPEIGVVGAMLYYPNNTIQHGGVMLGIGGVAGHAYTGAPRGYPGHKHRAGLAQKLSRSEEHKSELQSIMRHSYAVFCLKKKK